MRTVLALIVRKPACACSHNLHAAQNDLKKWYVAFYVYVVMSAQFYCSW